MKEIRAYLIHIDSCDNYDLLSDDEFMDIAEEQGTVYSLKGFAQAFNNEMIDDLNYWLRFI